MEVFIIIAIAIAVYWFATREKRQEQKAAFLKEKQDAQERIQSDPEFTMMAEYICESVTNLKDAAVRVLREGGHFYLIFVNGNVSYETRWVEKNNNVFEENKNTQKLLNRGELGKNPLTFHENKYFAELVKEKLLEYSWLSVSNLFNIQSGCEIEVRKKADAVIPEA